MTKTPIASNSADGSTVRITSEGSTVPTGPAEPSGS